jgi:hypothetical protein
MSEFEFFMGFYGLLLGLSTAELLLGFGNLFRAPVQPRWGAITPLVGLLIFVEIIASFADAWIKLQSVTIAFGGLTIPALIGVNYFVATMLVTPRRADDWESLDDYYFARGRWAVAVVIVVNILTIVFLDDLFGRVALFPPEAQVAYAIANIAVVGSLMLAFFARMKGAVVAGLSFATTTVVILYATPLDISEMVHHLLRIE